MASQKNAFLGWLSMLLKTQTFQPPSFILNH
jgi:hypothetical protein